MSLSLPLPASLLVWSTCDHSQSSPSLSDVPPPSMTITSDEASNTASSYFPPSVTSAKEAGMASLSAVTLATEFRGGPSSALTSLPVTRELRLSVSAVLLTTKVTTSDPLTSVSLRCLALTSWTDVSVLASPPVLMVVSLWLVAAVSIASSTLTISSSPSSSGSAD